MVNARLVESTRGPTSRWVFCLKINWCMTNALAAVYACSRVPVKEAQQRGEIDVGESISVCACYLFSSLVNANELKYCVSCYIFLFLKFNRKKKLNKRTYKIPKNTPSVQSQQQFVVISLLRISDGCKCCNVFTIALFSCGPSPTIRFQQS